MPRRSKKRDDSPFGRVSTYLEDSREEIVSLMKSLVEINAVGPENGGPGEKAKADFLVDWLRKNGFEDVEVYEADHDGVPRPNLVTWLEGEDSESRIIFMSHLDVVPPGDISAWYSEPFELKREGDKLIGRGVEDDNQGLVASIFAAKALMECGLRPGCGVGLLMVADEETGSRHGIGWLLEHRRDLFRPEDVFVVPDAGNEDGSRVEVAEKSILWLRFRTVGRQAHASTPHLARNAFVAASHLVCSLPRLYTEFDARDPLFEPSMCTFEPTRKDPNVENVNTIPGEDVFYMDCRVLPQVSVEDVLRAIREIVREVERTQRVVIETEVVQRQDASRPTPSDSPIVQALCRSIERVYRVRPKPMGIGGGTVAALLRKAGFPAVVWQRIDETGHMPNEYAWLPNIIGDAKVFADLMMRGLKHDKPANGS